MHETPLMHHQQSKLSNDFKLLSGLRILINIFFNVNIKTYFTEEKKNKKEKYYLQNTFDFFLSFCKNIVCVH